MNISDQSAAYADGLVRLSKNISKGVEDIRFVVRNLEKACEDMDLAILNIRSLDAADGVAEFGLSVAILRRDSYKFLSSIVQLKRALKDASLVLIEGANVALAETEKDSILSCQNFTLIEQSRKSLLKSLADIRMLEQVLN